jgi:DNA polymerase-4
MPMAHAVRLCPHLAIVRPEFRKYRAISSEIFAIYREVTPLVEPLSLDEAYLDVTENAWGEPLGRTVAERLKARIREQTHLTVSAGVAPNKFLAKIASGWQKPDGLTVIAPGRVERFLHGLPIDALWGVGPVTAARLREHGIVRLTDVRAIALDDLRRLVGSLAPWLQQLANGVDDRAVEPNREARSASTENTFQHDLVDRDVMRTRVDEMAREVAGWLSRKQRVARTVTLKVRYHDFTTVTRSVTMEPASDDADTIAARAAALLDRTEAGTRPVRLLGVGVHNLARPGEDPPEIRPSRSPLPRLPFDEEDAR